MALGGHSGASSLGEGTSSIEGWALFACTLRMPACRTSVICNIISASTMTAMRESTPQGREGGRETACLSKRGTFFVLIRKYNEPLKKQEKRSLLRLMENKLIW